MEGIVSCDDFFQATQASVTHSALHTIATETATYPNGREITNTAGMKIKATARKATVLVYPVPVGFLDASNKSTSSVVKVPKKRGIGTPDLAQRVREWAEVHTRLLLSVKLQVLSSPIASTRCSRFTFYG